MLSYGVLFCLSLLTLILYKLNKSLFNSSNCNLCFIKECEKRDKK